MICEYCGQEFTPNLRGRPQKYCNRNCGMEAWRKDHPEKQKQYFHTLYNENKQKALAYKGGKCVVTGRTDSIVFHHLNPNGKNIEIADLFHRSWAVVKAELDNGVIPLTRGIHSTLHNKLRSFIKKCGVQVDEREK